MMISIRRLTSAWNSNFSALAANFSLSAGVKEEAAANGEGTTVGAAALSEDESSADTNEASLTIYDKGRESMCGCKREMIC